MTDTNAAAQTITAIRQSAANAERRGTPVYTNATPRTGSGTAPRRLISDTGFLIQRAFGDLLPNSRNYEYGDTDGPRDIQQILIVPYGTDLDYRRLESPDPRDRAIRTLDDGGTGGVVPYPAEPQFLMSGALDANACQTEKTTRVKRAAISTQGPAPHFIINRNGDLTVCLSVDAKTAYLPEFHDTGLFIAVESALVILREDHAAERFDRYVELPLAPVQLTTLAVLVEKLLTALGPTFPRAFVEDPVAPGFQYAPPDGGIAGSETFPLLRNFSLDTNPLPGVNPNFHYPTPTSFLAPARSAHPGLAAQQGPFDLATEVWRPLDANPPPVGRDLMRSMVDSMDTLGTRAVVMGNYSSQAAGARSHEMQSRARREVFAARVQDATRAADAGTAEAAAVAENVSAVSASAPPATGYEPHAYDFVDGHWMDGPTF